MLSGTPYLGYVYAYPHKTAYRPLRPAAAARGRVGGGAAIGLFLYLHVPFCEMRCGFCNLFTTANREGRLVAHYLDALRRQAEAVRAAMPRCAVRPLRASAAARRRTSTRRAGRRLRRRRARDGRGPATRSPLRVETSPDTADHGQARASRARGVDRVSIGVQSFVEAETAACGRPQRGARSTPRCHCSPTPASRRSTST